MYRVIVEDEVPVLLTEIAKLWANWEPCRKSRWQSVMYSNREVQHLPQAFPQTTIINRRYVQWLAFNSIILREQPCAKILPKDTLELEVPMCWSSMTYNINTNSSVFPFKVKAKRDFFFPHWTEVSLLLPPFPSLCCVCRLPVSISLFSQETHPLHAGSV